MENIKCPDCGNTADFDFWIEEEYNDGSNEPNTSNRLVNVEYWQCLKCSEIFTKVINDKPNYKERYSRIAKLKWFKDAYVGRSLGDIIEIND